VACNAKAYTTDRVKEDLRHRFKLHLTAEQRAKAAAKTLDVRRACLETAFEGLEKAQAQQRELSVEIHLKCLCQSQTCRKRLAEDFALLFKTKLSAIAHQRCQLVVSLDAI